MFRKTDESNKIRGFHVERLASRGIEEGST